MSTSQYTYSPFHTIGAASVLLWDAAAAGGSGAWAHFARVADATVLATTEQVSQHLVIKGLGQPIARRNRSKRYSLSFRLLEDANPAALDVLFSDGAVQSKTAAQDISTSEALRLYGTDYTELAHPFGILNGGLPPVTGLSASAGGAGGNILPGSYYYWVVPYVRDGAEERLGQVARTSQVNVSAGQLVTLSFNPPVGYQPDGYKIVYTLLSTLTSPLLLVVSSPQDTEVVISSHQGATPIAFQFDDGVIVVKSYDGQETFIAGNDYVIDVLRGLLKRVAGGAIGDGERVVVSYSYRRPPSVSTPLGDCVELERYRKLKLTQLAPNDANAGSDLSPATWQETGVEFEFGKVNVASGDVRLPFTEDDFSEGASVSWDCLFDPAEGRVGLVRSTYGVLAQY